MVPFAPLLAALERMPDPRRAQGTRSLLPHLLLFSVLAVLAACSPARPPTAASSPSWAMRKFGVRGQAA